MRLVIVQLQTKTNEQINLNEYSRISLKDFYNNPKSQHSQINLIYLISQYVLFLEFAVTFYR